MSRDAALMFSGGLDSTYAAVTLLERHRRVHLLTYTNEYGHYAVGRVRRRLRELERRFPGRFVLQIISIRDLFDELLVDRLAQEYRTYRSGFIWCLGCKLAMHTRSILYCRENGVKYMSDGSSADTDEMVEQMPVSLALVRALYARWGVAFSTPVYDIPRSEKRSFLDGLGFFRGLPVGDRAFFIQPRCIPGELYYLPFVLLGQTPRHDEEMVARFIRDKGVRLDAWLTTRLGARPEPWEEVGHGDR